MAKKTAKPASKGNHAAKGSHNGQPTICEVAKAGKAFKVPVRLMKSHVAAKPWDGAKVGATTGLVITHFFNELLALQRDSQHASEADLAATVLREFPNRIKAGGTLQSLTAYRGYYNGGKHGFGSQPGDGPTPEAKRVRSFGDDGEMRSAGEAKPAKKAKGGKAKAKGKGKAKATAA